MVFPVVLRGRPGTSARNHPHETSTSKPVVPVRYVPSSLAPDRPRVRFGSGRRELALDLVDPRGMQVEQLAQEAAHHQQVLAPVGQLLGTRLTLLQASAEVGDVVAQG